MARNPASTPVDPELNSTLSRLRGLMDQASNLPRPQVRSAGQARAFGLQADDALATKLRTLLKTYRQLTLTPDPQGEAAQKKAAGEIIEAAKAKPSPPLELALALVAATENERLDVGAVKLLDGLVVEGGFGLEILELRILRDLARRAASPGSQPWSEDAVKLAWGTIVLGERACNRPAALPWVRKLLEQAESSLHEARVLLQSDARTS